MTEGIPSGLSRESKRLWRRLTEIYDLSDPAARVILTTALQARDRIEEARKAVKRDGICLKDRYGGTRAHPALAIEHTARRQMLHAFKELGLQPGDVA